MISLLDIAERTQKGPKMEEKVWDLGLFAKMRELIRKYELTCPRDGSFFNLDDALADRAFHASVDFLAEQGVYCITTNRVVKFDREEVLQGIREMPSEVLMGQGRDVRMFKQRRIEEHEALNHVPGHHAPFSEQMAPLAVKNFAMMASCDYVEGFNFKVIDGREIYGMPIESYAARRQVAWLREGVRKAGRPGLGIAFYPITTRASVLVAPMDPDYGLRRTDGLLLSVLPDVKMEQDMLTAAIVYNDYGAFRIGGGGTAMAGGFCGDVEGAIIEAIVRGIAEWLVYRDQLHGSGLGHVSRAKATTLTPAPELWWAMSVVAQALARNTNMVLYNGGYSFSGPGTEGVLLERALQSIKVPVNGTNLMFPRHTRAQVDAAQTPFEAEWDWEVATAVMRGRFTRADADEAARRVARLLEGRPPEPAQDVRECYDWVHHRPAPAYNEKYLRVKEHVAACGLPFA
ncbi:MAG: monomethylamine:corrinoid methyltransferase [Chloroflexi bacterium]|nr:monomethylamine:corrinoid methyltransferase [Chloroflexota bacterium]